MNNNELKAFLDQKYLEYATSNFLIDDPIQIPHRFSNKLDIEIAGFFAALFAWGQRKTIINKCTDLLNRMDNAPGEFALNAGVEDLKSLKGFVHRTFNGEDLIGFVVGLGQLLNSDKSLEKLFYSSGSNLKNGLVNFKKRMIETGLPRRSWRHLPDPSTGSAAKRMNMYLRWMVRNDAVDFGIWQKLSTAQLSCPLDVHSGRTARALGLLKRKQNDWKAVEELDAALRRLDAKDPIKYDFALFGLGVFEKFH